MRTPATFRALRHRNFRLFWSGQVVSLTGTWMQIVAQGWLMYRLSASPFLLGLLGFAQFAPVMLFSLAAGVVADRVDKRRSLLITQGLAMAQGVLMAALTSAEVIEPWMILVLAFAFGTINAFDMPLRQSMMVEIVGREDLSNAIALGSSAFNMARIVGPAIAGIVVARLGEEGCFWLNAVSYVGVLAALSRMDPWVGDRDTTPDAPWRRLRNGIVYAATTVPLRRLLLLLGLMAGFGFQYMVLLPIYARDILAAGAEGFGLLVSAFGLGSLTSAMMLTRRLNRRQLRRNLLLGLGVAAAGMGTFALSRVMWLSLPAGFISGFGLILYVASTNTLLQLTTEDRYRGRIMSLYTLMLVGTAPLGAMTAGAIAQRANAPVATLVSAAVLLLGAGWVARRLRAIARAEAEGRVTVPVPDAPR